MKIIRLLHLTFARWYYNLALKQICPLHKDVPYIVHRRLQLEDKHRKLWA